MSGLNGGALRWMIALALMVGGCSSCGGERASTPRTAMAMALPTPVATVDAGTVDAQPVLAATEPVAIVTEQPEPVRVDAFFAREDAPIRDALAHTDVSEIERGRGGRSLGFKITLADGTRGYFKPDQTFSGTSWYAEVAAYHLDRELGFGRVAPVVERRFAWDDLRPVAGNDARVSEVLVDEDGTVEGSFVYWVPERLEPIELPEGWEQWLRVEGQPDAITPFQRPGAYARAMARRRAGEAIARPTDVPEPDTEERPAELSDLIVFDYLTNNLDRWSDNRTNVRTVGEGGPIMFLDNSAGFTLRAPRVPISDRRLAHVQKFRRSTVEAIRDLDVERFAERLEEDPLSPELDAAQLRNLETRRQFLLAHVDRLIAEHGEDAVLAW